MHQLKRFEYCLHKRLLNLIFVFVPPRTFPSRFLAGLLCSYIIPSELEYIVDGNTGLNAGACMSVEALKSPDLCNSMRHLRGPDNQALVMTRNLLSMKVL